MRTPPALPRHQHGALLILLVIALGILAATVFVGMLSSSDIQNQRDKTTAAALAEAKAALIGFAVGVNLTTTANRRPGDLPCPDLNNDGIAETSCGNAAGTTDQNLRIGRLPWKTLGLNDLRDGEGERLWYAVSNNFKNNTRTVCTSPGQLGCLNSDSKGTITIRNSNGQITYDGNGSTGAVAIVISPGAVLQRQGAANTQDRSCTIGTNCDVAEKCTTSPASLTPKCNPTNYLDIGNGEDNADFVDSNSNGFINGLILVANPLNPNNRIVIVNDRLLTISADEIIPLLAKRVGGEVMNCLSIYSTTNQNNQRYPWAAKLDISVPPNYNYNDATDIRFGRIPDSPFSNTQTSSGNINTMDKVWPGACKITSNSGWWLNWKEMVFYGVADTYKPSTTNPPLSPPCPSCLRVNPPSTTADKHVVVIVAGKMLPGQSRTTNPNKGDAANYLEGGNESGIDMYTSGNTTPTFNDYLLYK
ncbi:hypothetical protein [Sulfuriferula sp.]|uniref:hypothetical protein n=1 Tax=Sulfuriferula sp. TaxID=2025307 RepID=UPI002730B2D1|nr:hypothetical protein [Sulfuriferula sp.]MDP2027628.1 hypothetical protein [Sulfuriferula sp.]